MFYTQLVSLFHDVKGRYEAEPYGRVLRLTLKLGEEHRGLTGAVAQNLNWLIAPAQAYHSSVLFVRLDFTLQPCPERVV
jgi:hypothetical protein